MSGYKYPFLDLKAVNSVFQPALDEAAMRVIGSGRYIGGEETERFESVLAELCKVPYAIGVSNGFDALRLILTAWVEMGLIAKGSGVIVPANTFVASALAIIHAGLKPLFVDPDIRTLNISAEAIEQACAQDSTVKAVMPVHLYGRLAWDKEIMSVVTRRNLLVIEDAAQAIGASAACDGLFGSRRAGALGHAGAFSFYPTKNIGALGDGGAIVTSSKKLAETVRSLANYGSTAPYTYTFAGFNCRLDPIQAAMLSVKLPETLRVNARRFERAVAYNNVIANPIVIKPEITRHVTDQTWHQYVVRVNGGRRKELRNYLASHGVETALHYPVALHRQEGLRNIAHRPLPIAELLTEEVMSLPVADGTSVADAATIGRIINDFQPS